MGNKSKPLTYCSACRKNINEPDIEKIYELLGKLLSEDLDCEIKLTVTRKE